jgi:thiol-disulfide isomerase/thioredoxin
LSSKAGAVGKIDRSHAGEIAPTIEFTDPDGEPVSLADFRGQPLLLNLWATWCAPCVVEMPALDALAARGDAIRVLAVSQDMEGQEAKVAAFFEERRLKSLEPYQDKQLGLMEKLNAEVLPTTLLYDSEGREVWRVTGAFDWTGAEATKLLAEARPANPRA